VPCPIVVGGLAVSLASQTVAEPVAPPGENANVCTTPRFPVKLAKVEVLLLGGPISAVVVGKTGLFVAIIAVGTDPSVLGVAATVVPNGIGLPFRSLSCKVKYCSVHADLPEKASVPEGV